MGEIMKMESTINNSYYLPDNNANIQTNSTDNTSNKKTDSSQTKHSTELFESLLNQTNENQKQILQQNKDEESEKMSNKDLLDGVTYNPYTDKYTLIMEDYGVTKIKLDVQRLTLIDNSTTITSDQPITKEYLHERYKKIQHYIKTEYAEFNLRASADNSILRDLGMDMTGIKHRDTFGIVKIDGEYIEIDGDEFKRHYRIYLNAQEGMSIAQDHGSSVYYKELNGIDPSFENAEEFESYINDEKWEGSHINEMYRKISLAVNLGLVEEGDQTLFPILHQTNKASYTFRNIENDILSQAVLDSIGSKYTSIFESVMYEYIFGTDDDFFQNKLNEFAKELEYNPSKYPSVNSNFTFTGDINLDENSSQEYKNFITDTLVDFMQKQKYDYMDEKNITYENDEKNIIYENFGIQYSMDERDLTNDDDEKNHIYDNLGIQYGFVKSFEFIIDSLKDSKSMDL